jgi:hypothetical protein
MKNFALGVSITINVMLIILIVVFLNTPTRFVTCDKGGECYEIDVTYGEYIFAKD